MTEAGQIFALLRSSSAAKLAKRFGAVDEGAGPAPAPQSSAQTGAGSAAGIPRGQGTVPLPTPSGQGAAATLPVAGVGAVLPGSVAAVPDEAVRDPGDTLRAVPIRAAVSLGHLAPPRSNVARLLAEASTLGLARMVVAAATEAQGLAAAVAASAKVETAATVLPGVVAGPSPTDTPDTQTVKPGADHTQASAAGVGTGSKSDTAPGSTSRIAAGASADAPTASTTLAGVAAAGLAPAEARSAAQLGPAAQIAFAEAMVAMLAVEGSGRSTSVASGVIFNAAMTPGWPFPSAFARDGAEMINPKALLHRLAGSIEAMSPQEAAEYLARIGGGHVFLRNLRRILKELDMLEKDDVKGLLFAFLETLSTIASGLQTAFRQLAESAALQAAVVHGEEPEDGDRPGRRRLKL
jgi:hypothetical protein